MAYHALAMFTKLFILVVDAIETFSSCLCKIDQICSDIKPLLSHVPVPVASAPLFL